MTIGPLSTRDRRALQRGALIVAAALLYVLGIRPSRERRALLVEQLEAERAVLARELSLSSDTLERGPSARATAPQALFTGADAVIASASLAEYVAAEAEQHDVWLQQATTRTPNRAQSRSANVEVSVRAESDLQGVLRLLRALEEGRMLVQTHAIDLRAERGADDDGTAPLAMTATLRSAARAGGGAP